MCILCNSAACFKDIRIQGLLVSGDVIENVIIYNLCCLLTDQNPFIKILILLTSHIYNAYWDFIISNIRKIDDGIIWWHDAGGPKVNMLWNYLTRSQFFNVLMGITRKKAQRRAAADRSRHKSHGRIQYQGPYFLT